MGKGTLPLSQTTPTPLVLPSLCHYMSGGGCCCSIPTAGPGSPPLSGRSPGGWDGSGTRTKPQRQSHCPGTAATGHLPLSCPSRDQRYQGWVSHGLQKHLKAREETPIGSFLGSTAGRKKEKKSWRKVREEKDQAREVHVVSREEETGMLEGGSSWNWPRRCPVPPRWLELDTRPGSEALAELTA